MSYSSSGASSSTESACSVVAKAVRNGSTAADPQTLGWVRNAPPRPSWPVVPSKKRRSLAQRQAGGELRHVDREVLVVVALPGDAGVERDRPQAEEAEREAGRFTRSAAPGCRRAGRRNRAGSGRRAPTTCLLPTLRVFGTARERQHFFVFAIDFEFALRRRLVVDAAAQSGKSTRKVFGAADGAAGFGGVFDDDLGERVGRVAGGLLEEEFRRFRRAELPASFSSSLQSPACQPLRAILLRPPVPGFR